MAHRLTFLPKQRESLTLEDFQARFRSLGFLIESGSSLAWRTDRKGPVVFKTDEGPEIYAYALIGLSALEFHAEETLPLVEDWGFVADQTSAELWEHQFIVSPNDVASMRACAERIAAAHRANVKICRSWTNRGTKASDGSDFAANT